MIINAKSYSFPSLLAGFYVFEYRLYSRISRPAYKPTPSVGRSIKVEKLLCLKAKDTIITNIINQKAIERL